MTFCAYENRDFPDSEFSTDENGVVWHEKTPRHTTLGDPEDPDDVPGLEEADIGDEVSGDSA
jgi:hypothetical protein